MSRILIAEDDRRIAEFIDKGLRAAAYSSLVVEDGASALLTASDSVADTVHGLESGANDYMTKPFQFAELLARIRLRLKDDAEPGMVLKLSHGDLELDLRSRRVQCGGATADLTAREFSLLEVFLRHPQW